MVLPHFTTIILGFSTSGFDPFWFRSILVVSINQKTNSNEITYQIKTIIYNHPILGICNGNALKNYDLSNALKKFTSLKQQFSDPANLVSMTHKMTNTPFKDRFLVRLGNHIHSIKAGDISLFYASGRTVYLVTKEGRKFILDYKLEDLCDLLNPKMFYRCNRTYVVNINAISDVVVYSNSRLKIDVDQQLEKEIIVSREKVSGFKKWLEGE